MLLHALLFIFFSIYFQIKEKITLEDALKTINGQQKRINSADSRGCYSGNTSMTNSTSDIINGYNNKNRSNININNINIKSNLKKSSSFSDINTLIPYYNKAEEQKKLLTAQITGVTNNSPRVSSATYNNNKNKILINDRQSQNQQPFINLHAMNKPDNISSNNHNNNNNENDFQSSSYFEIKQTPNYANNFNTTLNNANTTPPTVNINNTNNNNNNNFKSTLEETQKALHNLNKEALNDFKNLVMNEVKTTNQIDNLNVNYNNDNSRLYDGHSNNISKNVNDMNSNSNYDHINKNIINSKSNHTTDYGMFQVNNHQNKPNALNSLFIRNNLRNSDREILTADGGLLNDDVSSISDITSDSEDSLEASPVKNNNKQRIKSANKANGNSTGVKNDTIIEVKIPNDSNEQEKPSAFMNQLANIKNHFITKTLTTDFLSNSLLANKKTYFTPQFNSDYSLSKDISSNTSANKTTTIISKQNTNIKSILKRSTSDSNVTLLSQNNSFNQFGLKAEKIEVKDSIEVANSRAQSTKPKSEIIAVKKKSVRFAQNGNENEKEDIESAEDLSAIINNETSIFNAYFHEMEFL